LVRGGGFSCNQMFRMFDRIIRWSMAVVRHVSSLYQIVKESPIPAASAALHDSGDRRLRDE